MRIHIYNAKMSINGYTTDLTLSDDCDVTGGEYLLDRKQDGRGSGVNLAEQPCQAQSPHV